MKTPRALSLLACAGLGAGLSIARSTASEARTAPLAPVEAIRVAAEGADLVFEGVVESVEYALSTPSYPAERALPFSYVTFRVERVFRGGFDDRGRTGRLTLRFLGGPLEGPGALDGPWLHSSHGAEFEVGSREVLLVAGHELWETPLVPGLRRAKILDDRVLTEDGRVLAAQEALPFQVQDDGSRAPQGIALDARAFRDWLSNQLDPEAGKRVRSVFPDEPLDVAPPAPTAGLLAPTSTRPPVPAEDRLELGLFELHGHNPVLR